MASYTSTSGPPLDHLGTVAQGWRGRLRMRHGWYVALPLLPWLPEQLWAHLQWLVRPLACRLDPTSALLPRGRTVRENSSHTIDLYRVNVIARLREPLPWRTSLPIQLVVATRDAFVTSA